MQLKDSDSIKMKASRVAAPQGGKGGGRGNTRICPKGDPAQCGDLAPNREGSSTLSPNKGNELMDEWQKPNYSKPKIWDLQRKSFLFGVSCKKF